MRIVAPSPAPRGLSTGLSRGSGRCSHGSGPVFHRLRSEAQCR